jgi:type VI protein secretion system component VasK
LKQGSAEKSIQERFIQEYIAYWQKFVAGFSVIPYRSAADAAVKLGILSDHKSPLLAIMALTADETNYSAPVETGLAAGIKKKAGDLLGSSEKKVQQFTGTEQHQIGILDITRAFQPVQYVVPPASDRWITDKNSAYINFLTELQSAIQALSRPSTNDAPPDPQAAQAAADKAEASVRQMQQGFSSEGMGGVDREVTRLLEEPIKFAQPYVIPPSPGVPITREWQKFCASAQPLFSKYPFNAAKIEGQPNSEATLKEVQDIFAPEQGAVWKLQQSALAELTIFEGGVWKANPAAQKLKASQELLDFLNRAQQLRKAFFADGTTPHLTYSLRPRIASGSNQFIQLTIDGESHDFTADQQMRHQFTWPSASGAEAKAEGRSGTSGSGGFSVGFDSHYGLWAVFRVFGDAAHRDPGAPVIEWKETRGGTGRPQALEPPVQLEFVGGFPGGADVFNPEFYKGFRCSFKPVQ